jgi:hypothetical protein
MPGSKGGVRVVHQNREDRLRPPFEGRLPASLLIVEVLSNISDHEDEKNSSEFFEPPRCDGIKILPGASGFLYIGWRNPFPDNHKRVPLHTISNKILD